MLNAAPPGEHGSYTAAPSREHRKGGPDRHLEALSDFAHLLAPAGLPVKVGSIASDAAS